MRFGHSHLPDGEGWDQFKGRPKRRTGAPFRRTVGQKVILFISGRQLAPPARVVVSRNVVSFHEVSWMWWAR